MGELTLLAALLFVSVTLFAQQALVIVDIQDFYFPGGRSELVEPAMARDIAHARIKQMLDEGKPMPDYF